MLQTHVTCRACQREFLVSTDSSDQLDVRCPLCGLTLIYPNPRGPASHPPEGIVPWDRSLLDCG
jgi:ribosomal protein S27E